MLTPDCKISGTEIEQRIEALRQTLKANGTDGALIVQKADLFYFTGTAQDAHLYVPAVGEPVLMVRKSIERAISESPIRNIVLLSGSGQIPDILKASGIGLPDVLGMELDVLPANLYMGYQKRFAQCRITDVSHLIRTIRAVKSEFEIGLIREAAQLGDQVFASVREFLREGMPEIELAGLVEARARKLGHQGLVRMRLWGGELFYGHLMAGPSAAVPSFLASPTGGTGTNPAIAQSAGFRPVKKHEPVLVDYVFAHKGYIADQTRIFALGGLPDDLLKAHSAMLDVQALIKKAAKPGVLSGDLYHMAVERAAELGYADHFMGADDQRIRFVGHGVGLELDEYPFLAKGQKSELQTGMVIALEPKLIFPGKGVVGIENTHVVTPDGLETLSRFDEAVQVI